MLRLRRSTTPWRWFARRCGACGEAAFHKAEKYHFTVRSTPGHPFPKPEGKVFESLGVGPSAIWSGYFQTARCPFRRGDMVATHNNVRSIPMR